MYQGLEFRARSARYTGVAKGLHWLLAVLIFGQIAFGWYLQSVPRKTPARTVYVNLHKSTGLMLGLLVLVRLGWRLTHKAPPLPAPVPAWERAAARASHIGLYACMLVMPTAGYLASNFSKFGVNLFNTVLLPPWGVDDRRLYTVFNTTHVVTSYVFAALIAVHILAALRHLYLGDGVFMRMWRQRSAP
ncbi:MAG: cytochrome b [Burkholderiales bacterium]